MLVLFADTDSDLTPDKAQTLYALLYELLDNQKNKQMEMWKGDKKHENRL